MISNHVNFQSADFINLCKTHRVKVLYAFGSIVNGNFTNQSDIDLIVDIDETNPLNRGELLLSFWDRLEQYFDRNVDLLTFTSLRNPYLKDSIHNTMRLI